MNDKLMKELLKKNEFIEINKNEYEYNNYHIVLNLSVLNHVKYYKVIIYIYHKSNKKIEHLDFYFYRHSSFINNIVNLIAFYKIYYYCLDNDYVINKLNPYKNRITFFTFTKENIKIEIIFAYDPFTSKPNKENIEYYYLSTLHLFNDIDNEVSKIFFDYDIFLNLVNRNKKEIQSQYELIEISTEEFYKMGFIEELNIKLEEQQFEIDLKHNNGYPMQALDKKTYIINIDKYDKIILQTISISNKNNKISNILFRNELIATFNVERKLNQTLTVLAINSLITRNLERK